MGQQNEWCVFFYISVILQSSALDFIEIVQFNVIIFSDIFHSFTRDESEIRKKVIYEFSSNDDSSDSEGKNRKRVWRSKTPEHTFKFYIFPIILIFNLIN